MKRKRNGYNLPGRDPLALWVARTEADHLAELDERARARSFIQKQSDSDLLLEMLKLTDDDEVNIVWELGERERRRYGRI